MAIRRIGPRRPRKVFHKEWREHLGLTLETVGGRIKDGIDRGTVQRWEKEPWRLDPFKMAALAEAYDIEVEQLWSHPPKTPPPPSIDAILRGAPEELRATVFDLVGRLVKQAS